MLKVGSKHNKKPQGGILLAKDRANNQSIWWIPDSKDAMPTQTICGSPLSVVEDEELLKLFKKFTLSKREVARLLAFYKDPDVLEVDFGDEFKLKCAFQCLE